MQFDDWETRRICEARADFDDRNTERQLLQVSQFHWAAPGGNLVQAYGGSTMEYSDGRAPEQRPWQYVGHGWKPGGPAKAKETRAQRIFNAVRSEAWNVTPAAPPAPPRRRKVPWAPSELTEMNGGATSGTTHAMAQQMLRTYRQRLQTAEDTIVENGWGQRPGEEAGTTQPTENPATAAMLGVRLGPAARNGVPEAPPAPPPQAVIQMSDMLFQAASQAVDADGAADVVRMFERIIEGAASPFVLADAQTLGAWQETANDLLQRYRPVFAQNPGHPLPVLLSTFQELARLQQAYAEHGMTRIQRTTLMTAARRGLIANNPTTPEAAIEAVRAEAMRVAGLQQEREDRARDEADEAAENARLRGAEFDQQFGLLPPPPPQADAGVEQQGEQQPPPEGEQGDDWQQQPRADQQALEQRLNGILDDIRFVGRDDLADNFRQFIDTGVDNIEQHQHAHVTLRDVDELIQLWMQRTNFPRLLDQRRAALRSGEFNYRFGVPGALPSAVAQNATEEDALQRFATGTHVSVRATAPPEDAQFPAPSEDATGQEGVAQLPAPGGRAVDLNVLNPNPPNDHDMDRDIRQCRGLMLNARQFLEDSHVPGIEDFTRVTQDVMTKCVNNGYLPYSYVENAAREWIEAHPNAKRAFLLHAENSLAPTTAAPPVSKRDGALARLNDIKPNWIAAGRPAEGHLADAYFEAVGAFEQATQEEEDALTSPAKSQATSPAQSHSESSPERPSPAAAAAVEPTREQEMNNQLRAIDDMVGRMRAARDRGRLTAYEFTQFQNVVTAKTKQCVENNQLPENPVATVATNFLQSQTNYYRHEESPGTRVSDGVSESKQETPPPTPAAARAAADASTPQTALVANTDAFTTPQHATTPILQRIEQVREAIKSNGSDEEYQYLRDVVASARKAYGEASTPEEKRAIEEDMHKKMVAFEVLATTPKGKQRAALFGVITRLQAHRAREAAEKKSAGVGPAEAPEPPPNKKQRKKK